MTSERAELYNALEQVIGKEPARMLMERIHETGDLATKAEVAELGRDMNLRFERVDARFDAVDARFDAVDARFERVDARFDPIDARLEKIDARFEKLDDRLFQFHETLRGYSRTFVTAQVTSIIGAVGLAVGIIKFF